MTLRSWLTRGALLALPLTLAAGIALPASAEAYIIGDAQEITQVAGVPFSDANSLIPIPAPHDDFERWYEVPLRLGQTIEVTATTQAANAFSWVWSANVQDPYDVLSWQVSPGVHRVRYMAPRTGEYFIAMIASTAGTFTVNAAVIPPVPFSLTSMVAKKRVRANRTLNVSARVMPSYNSSTSPIRFYLQRKSGGTWKTYGASKAGKLTVVSASYSKFNASYKLPRGTYRVRAGFKDAAHPTTKYNRYKTVTVK